MSQLFNLIMKPRRLDRYCIVTFELPIGYSALIKNISHN